MKPNEVEKIAYYYKRFSKSKSESLFKQGLFKANISHYYQMVFHKMIVDFYMPHRGLIIEIDGKEHIETKDSNRDKLLQGFGFKTHRFTNAEIYQDVDKCIQIVLTKYPESSELYRASKQNRRKFNKYFKRQRKLRCA